MEGGIDDDECVCGSKTYKETWERNQNVDNLKVEYVATSQNKNFEPEISNYELA